MKLDQRSHVATLIASDDQLEGLVAASQGNAQTTGDGDPFVGWGALPYFSELTLRGDSCSTRSSPQASIPAGGICFRRSRMDCASPHAD